MFPVSWTVVVLSLAVYAAVGTALGALTGFAVSFVLKLNFRGILEDTFLGSFGFVLGSWEPCSYRGSETQSLRIEWVSQSP